MKKWSVIIMAMLTAACLCACREKLTLVGVVSEVYDNAFMVVCTGEEGPFPEGERLYVNCKALPDIQPGDTLRIAFYDQVMLSEPPQIVAQEIEVLADDPRDVNCE